MRTDERMDKAATKCLSFRSLIIKDEQYSGVRFYTFR